MLPVADRHDAYAFRIVDRLKAEGFRAEMIDGRRGARQAHSAGAKTEKVPYVLVVGDADVENGTVGVNARGSDDPERDVPLDAFIDPSPSTSPSTWRERERVPRWAVEVGYLRVRIGARRQSEASRLLPVREFCALRRRRPVLGRDTLVVGANRERPSR